MAQIKTYVDDMNGSEATHPGVKLGFTNENGEFEIFEIDLGDANFEKVQRMRESWTARARKIETPVEAPAAAKRTSGTRKPADPEDKALRAWAPSAGIEIAKRGRIKDEHREAYRAHLAAQTASTLPATPVEDDPDVADAA